MAIDVGHHYGAAGARAASGMMEFELNLQLAYELRPYVEREGLRVRMIGHHGDYAVLRERPRDAAGAALFVSLHHDSVRRELLPRAAEFSGFSLFVSRENPQLARSLACASAIGAALRARGFAPSRYHADPALGAGRPYADEANGVHYFDELAVLRAAEMPALLVEAAVIVNPEEERRAREPRVRRAIARAIAEGIGGCLQ